MTNLSRLPAQEREVVLNAMDVACSWETWDQLRRVKGLSPARAEHVVSYLLQGALHTSREA